MRNEKIVIVSGYFDPLHIGHLEYFNLAKELGDKLVVIVNNDIQCKLKKGESFMNEGDRMEIIFALGIVDEVLLSSDTDGSVCDSLDKVVQFHNEVGMDYEFIFCNGGDRQLEEIPETEVCERLGIQMADGLGDKIRSSSEMTKLYPKERGLYTPKKSEYYDND